MPQPTTMWLNKGHPPIEAGDIIRLFIGKHVFFVVGCSICALLTNRLRVITQDCIVAFISRLSPYLELQIKLPHALFALTL